MESEEDLVAVDLTEIERNMLVIGLHDWGGPAYCTDPLAQALGFRNVQDLYDEGGRIADDIRHGRALSRRDWTRALASTEIMFGSSLLGHACGWGSVHGGDDREWRDALSMLRRKLPVSPDFLPG